MLISSEEIEALDKTDIQTIRVTAETLHDATPAVLETPMSPEDYEREEGLRSAMRIKITETQGLLAGQVSDLEAIKRDLGNLKSWLSEDAKRLKSLRIQGYVRESEERRKQRIPSTSNL